MQIVDLCLKFKHHFLRGDIVESRIIVIFYCSWQHSSTVSAPVNQRLKKVFNWDREVNLKFNKSKCIIGVTEVKFLGHVFNSEGIKPDSDRITVIFKMPSPKSVKDLQRFLGVKNYLCSYIPKLYDETTLLRTLLKNNTSWVWDENYDSFSIRFKTVSLPYLSYLVMNCRYH